MTHNSCGVCRVQVLDNDDAIQCDGNCGLWHHRECLGMRLGTYLNLSKQCGDWVCRKCVIIKQEIKKEVSIIDTLYVVCTYVAVYYCLCYKIKDKRTSF